MSATEEREIEIVAGTIGGITQKKADTWTVAVTPEGSQYAKNLWTKDVELVESLSTKIGQAGAFVCSASYWARQDGQQVRSLWIQKEGDSAAIEGDGSGQALPPIKGGFQPERVATPAAAPIAGASKDRLIVRQTCIKAAAQQIVPGDDVEGIGNQTMKLAAAYERWVTLGILEPIPFD